jgi:hypothetical protein
VIMAFKYTHLGHMRVIDFRVCGGVVIVQHVDVVILVVFEKFAYGSHSISSFVCQKVIYT